MIELHAQSIPYVIERSRRRTVGMLIDHAGLRVRASSAVSVVEIERILHSRSDWILKHLVRMQQTNQATSFVPNLGVEEGEIYPFWVSKCACIGIRMRLSSMQKNGWNVFWRMSKSLWCCGRRPLNIKKKTVRNALTAILLEYLFQRARRYAVAHSLRYRVIVLSSARTLWGTCRTDGTLRLNWRLIFLDMALVDYVLAHELSHTVHMNHSGLFWAQVAVLCPEYKTSRQRLKQYNLRLT